ncbi:transglutaminase-like domain-containing protein [Alteraurantiacibacter aquimixticola]|uniref:Transglutaminase family protein n=1 Tax=Alteraurantiacibacter aquimixticola TaxID=2489173 RepID=A0A4T3F390_9SPHN|nr:transglutaminase family protein [Alteraurantiacibacter aquimixticola]TIX51211.1 transglutaminase family protein [Alteraurantiacibacter aquimixticola]
MPIDISAHFTFRLDHPTDLLLQFEAADIPEQQVLSADTQLSEAIHMARVPAQDDIGERIWLRAEGEVTVDYSASVAISRNTHDIAALAALPAHELPGSTVKYLFDSRYCQADRMQSFVASRFGAQEGGAKIAAMRDWIAQEIAYEPGSSNATTTAVDTFVERRGICRDFAHVMVSLARAATIPARYVSCYAPRVTPQDFHAVAEVFLADPTVEGGGAWYLVDATGMAEADKTVKIGVGRDAADVSFLTVFGLAQFGDHRVEVNPRD